MPKDKNPFKVEGHFTHQQSESPITGNKNPKFGMEQDVPEPEEREENKEIYSKQTDRQTSLDDL